MDAKEYIQRQLATARRVCDAAVNDLTDEQLNWTPPGTSNPIGTILIHILAAEDRFIQAVLQGKPLVWQTEAWAEQIGLKSLPGYGQGWDESKQTSLTLASLLDYRASVRAATDTYMARLTPVELEREVELIGSQRPVADALAIMVVHIASHGGEIAALKGVQGLKGLPF